MSIDRYDQEMHPRCPPLGGPVPFFHCRRVNRGLPCHRIVVCWADRLDIAGFIREHYTAEEIERMNRPPPSRMGIVLETLDRVRGKGHPED